MKGQPSGSGAEYVVKHGNEGFLPALDILAGYSESTFLVNCPVCCFQPDCLQLCLIEIFCS